MSSKRNSNKREKSRSRSSDRDSYERSSKNKNERVSRFSSIRPSKSRRVYVSNVTFDATYLEVKDEFSSVGEVTFVQMLKDETNRFKGCAVITFKESEMAQEAIETMNRKEFKGRKLVVKEEDANPEHKGGERKRGREDFDTRAPLALAASMVQPPVNYNTYGLSMTFLNSLNIDLPLINIVFVANLDYTVTESNLKEVFSLAGKVLDTEIFKDKAGKSRGFGVVEYEHPVEAVQSISMLHNQTFKDRILTVRMDRSDRKKDSKPRLPVGLKSVGMGLGVDGKPLKDIKCSSTSFPSLPSVPPLPSLNPLSSMGGQMNPVSGLGGGSVPPSPLSSQINPGVGLMDSMAASRMGLNPGGAGGLSGGLGGQGVGMNPGGGRDFSSQGASYRGGGGGGGGGGGTLGNIIQISNLPLDYTSDSLRKLCWSYGDVRLAEMRSQGTGMVKFRSEADAQRAVEMLDRQPFEGRLLTARAL